MGAEVELRQTKKIFLIDIFTAGTYNSGTDERGTICVPGKGHDPHMRR